MLGCKSGVVMMLRGDQDYVSWASTAWPTAFKDAIRNNVCCRRVDVLLMGLYYFYHNSPLNRENFKASFEALNMRPLMPTRVGGNDGCLMC